MPQSQRQELSLWLHKSEAIKLRECIVGEIAALQAEAANAPLEEPIEYLVSKITGQFTEPMKKAARLSIFISVLDEVSDVGFLFQTTKLKPA